ncbi:uncharacterized protein LOC112590915 [Melanaphis sacchari]|uniref:uncharacterized protein LOC112590915 n=1 Tax=Melanaphis sacchari TaxID=742174 RepID=UPI000DC1421A|nr:uncharacterized protein LOC112590915 [Melanaphis sacchari]
MCAGCKGAAALLLVAAFAVAAADNNARWPRSRPTRVYRPNLDQAQFIEHVMLYEEQWTDVLQELIKEQDVPPNVKRLIGWPPAAESHGNKEDGDGKFHDAREIVAKMTTECGDVRSCVEYAAKAVRRALSCYTFRHVLFQVNSIALMMVKNAEPIVVLTAANALKKNAAAYMDVLAASPDDNLIGLLQIYWGAVDFTQYDNVQYLKERPYPEPLVKGVNSLSDKISDYLVDECELPVSQEDFFRRVGIRKKTPLFKDPDLDVIVKTESLMDVTSEHVKRFGEYAKELGIVTLPARQWSALFFDNGMFPTKSDLRRASTIVRDELKMNDTHKKWL